EDLAAWAIPDHIPAGAAESPWVLPRQVFARRADRLRRAPGGPSFERAWEALDPAGSVLDVGAGAGAACLPLAPRTTTPTAGDALAILAAMGRNPGHTEWSGPAEADYRSMAELVEVTRRRLCLPPERAAEVEAALVELGIKPGQPRDLGSSGRDVVTIWW